MQQKFDYFFEVEDNQQLDDLTHLLKVKPFDNRMLPEIYPGQFVNILIEGHNVFLRRPISICNCNRSNNELWLIVKHVGKGTEKLCNISVKEKIKLLFPLGKGFTLPTNLSARVLLIGGGVGIAPLYYMGIWLNMIDIKPSFLLGAKTVSEHYFVNKFQEIGEVYTTTDDGSYGFKGYVSDHSILDEHWDNFYVCGPLPMMKKIANIARERGVECEVSLENHMACGVGACLCCVEKTTEGNICVCKEGPVFNTKRLRW